MYYTTTDNQELYYEVSGLEAADQVLLFLNGVSQSTAAWTFMLNAFKDSHRIILCDFIFQGQSSKEGPYRDFDRHAEDIKGLLDHLGVKKVIPIGISYGSLVAQHFALNYPQRIDRLILLSTFAHKTPYFEAIELAWQRSLDSGGYALLLDVMLPTVLGEEYFRNPLIPFDLLKSNRNGLNQDPRALKKLMEATRLRPDYREKLKAIKSPTLVIHGEKDALISVQMGKAVADAIPGSEFEVIPLAGHTLNLEAIPQTIKRIKEFLLS